MENDDNVSNMSVFDDTEDFGNFMLSDSRFPLQFTEEEYNNIKAKIIKDLRIGSSLHIGEKMPFASAFEVTKDRQPYFSPDKYVRVGQSHQTTLANLLFARQYGLFRPSAHYYGLYDICNLNCFSSTADNRFQRWPPREDFKNHLMSSPWSVTSFGLAGVYEHHRGCVNAIAFNASGERIVSGSDDRFVAIMDTFSGDLITRYRSGHSLNVFQTKFVPGSGDLKLVSSARDGEVRLAELCPDGGLAGTPIRLVTHGEACHKIQFLFDQPLVFLTAGEDGIVYSIDLRNNEPQEILNLPLMPFYSISINPAKPTEFCVGGKYDAHVKVFDIRKIPSPGSPSDGYLYNFAPQHLVGASRNSARRDPALDRIDNGEDPVIGAVLDGEDGEQDEDDDDEEGGLRSFIRARLNNQIFNLLNMHSNTTARGNASSLSSRPRAPSAPPEDDVANRSSPSRTRRFDPLGDFKLSKFCVTSAVYSANGDAILVSLNDEDIYLFDSQDDKLPPLHVYRGHRNSDTVKRVSFYGPNSEYVVSGSDDGFIYIWDRHSEGIIQWLCGDLTFAVNSIEPHPYLPMMITCGCDNNVKLWAPSVRCHDLDTPGSWLKTMNNKESGRPPLFDPHKMVNSMILLRKSQLAKRLFGDNEDFRVSVEEDEGEIVLGRSPTVELTSEATPSASQSRKRKSPELDEAISSTQKLAKKEDGNAFIPAEPNQSTTNDNGKVYLTRAPQHHLPFNYKDLILRVGMNWGKRNRDSAAMMFTVDLPDIFRPLLNLDYIGPETDDDDGDDDVDSDGGGNLAFRFLRQFRSHSQSSGNDGEENVVGGNVGDESASTFSSSTSDSDSSRTSNINNDTHGDGDSPEEAPGSRPSTPNSTS